MKPTISISDGYVEYIYPMTGQKRKSIEKIYKIICKALDMPEAPGEIRTRGKLWNTEQN